MEVEEQEEERGRREEGGGSPKGEAKSGVCALEGTM